MKKHTQYISFLLLCYLLFCCQTPSKDILENNCQFADTTNVLLLNKTGCINCTNGDINILNINCVHNMLIDNGFLVISPQMRNIEKKNYVDKHNLKELTIIFSDSLFHHLRTKCKNNSTMLLKVYNDSVYYGIELKSINLDEIYSFYQN